jgi:hypothetical protein
MFLIQQDCNFYDEEDDYEDYYKDEDDSEEKCIIEA